MTSRSFLPRSPEAPAPAPDVGRMKAASSTTARPWRPRRVVGLDGRPVIRWPESKRMT